MDPVQRCLNAIDKIAGRVAQQAAAGIPNAHTGGVVRMIHLAVGAAALAIGLDGEEGEHGYIDGSTRLDAVNQVLAWNHIGYRLVELQRPRAPDLIRGIQ
jgi:hypothetical protein